MAEKTNIIEDIVEEEIIREYDFGGRKYKANQFGVVYDDKGKPKKQRLNQDGYPVVWLEGEKGDNGKRKRYYEKVHKIVATLFCEKPNIEEKVEVNHLDCVRSNNYYKNLEWITHKENVQYSIKKGFHKALPCVGENNIQSKLTEEDVRFIRKKYDNGMKIREIYRTYYFGKVTETSIENVCKRRTWKHIR